MNFQPINKSLFWGPQRSLDSEPDLNLPDPFDIEEEEIILDGNSQILLEDDVNFLSQNLPARLSITRKRIANCFIQLYLAFAQGQVGSELP